MLTREDRFWSHVQRGAADQCWPWLAYLDGNGYGRFSAHRAHRFAYEAVVGPIPAGLQLDHLCRNRACVNPAHMEIVTNRENQLRRPDVITARTRAVCPHGHTLSPEIIYVRPNGRPECRVCKRAAVRRWRERQRG